ncbi:asparagine synthase (glutamine-hydrolyzing) [Alphaproteobacteria bacterium]|nr:asparagine synthase (glutamine-hydrolyzing) [Alphaproteobacteria bacterium]
MCGITGYLNFDGKAADRDLLQRMTDSISHRGPDGEGHWIEGCIALGHRRLSIVDLSSAGDQPMISMDQRYVLTFNGEIYNFKELKSELESLGYWFRSNTDSEVVLNSLGEWGEAALSRFNGMFSLGLWDRQKRTLLLARDRYGIKPLYYGLKDSRISFASENKALLEDRDFDRELNKEALLEYFTFQNIFTENTLVKGIKMLPAGYFAVISLNDSKPALKLTQYWDYHFSGCSSVQDSREYVEELDRLFKQAVNRQLMGDVELGSYLSGGMDSGSITAIASQAIPNLKTFTCGFDLSSASGIELAFDERPVAEAMSAVFKSEHYEMVLKAGDMERCLKDLSFHLEEPRVGQSYPNYYAAKLASKFVKVVLSGSGGDELFGGYPWRYYRATGRLGFENYIDEYYLYWQRLATNAELRKLFSPVWNDVKHIQTRDIFRDVFSSHKNALEGPEDYINHSLYFEAKTFLHGLFVVEDKLSMAHGLESRVPFMDNDLVDFAMKCPVNLKLNNIVSGLRMDENEPGDKKSNYFQKTNDGKQILRTMMERHIPSSITKAPKKGFSSPDASWFKGESIDFVRKNLLSGDARIYEILDRKTVMELVNEHLSGSKNRRLLIWSLLNIEAYFADTGFAN